jgi:hypothetical protein
MSDKNNELGIIYQISNKFSKAIITKCSEKGCTLKFDGLGNFVAFKGEELIKDSMFKKLLPDLIGISGNDPNICDCIIFKANGDIIIGIIDLKSHNPSLSHAKEQLENGSKVVMAILKEIIGKIPKYNLFPIVLAKSFASSQIRKAHNLEIRVSGVKYIIIRKECGYSFSKIIKEEKSANKQDIPHKKKRR